MSNDDDLFWPSTYRYIKDVFCHVKRCKFDGECEVCPANKLRRYAARDSDRIGELSDRIGKLMEKLQWRDNTIAFLRGQVRGLEEKVEGYRTTINQLQREKGLPF